MIVIVIEFWQAYRFDSIAIVIVIVIVRWMTVAVGSQTLAVLTREETVAAGAQTLAGTNGRRLRSGHGRWCTDPWPVLTGEDGVVTVAISWVDIVFD